MLFYKDFSPNKLSDVFSLPGGESNQDNDGYEEDGQSKLTANGGGVLAGRGWLIISADHACPLLSS